ncbi:lysM domain receptor-like kinase 3 [Ziziphus jujuba]|uniref:LysM domain receptor-like kinase 3 n=1 Tax=Ziziphus jujuba TaxID=326968 RepID=A0ABM3ZX79_ZIZJJ|nr:lysM domain receptor-like kinase 3 [Ziziphus jujuba]
MESHGLLPSLLLLLTTLFSGVSTNIDVSIKSTLMSPFNCSSQIRTCNASLYHINYGTLREDQIAAFYSVSVSQMKPITYGNKQDYLITVPCSCNNMGGTTGYFYDTIYKVKAGDSFVNVSAQLYSGQALRVGTELFMPEIDFTMHLLCGCVESDTQTVATYTVQLHDTVSSIATLLSAKVENVVSLNRNLTENPDFIDIGWVLYVPMEKNGNENPKPGRRHKITIIIIIALAAVATLSVAALLAILLKRRRSKQKSEEDPKAVSKALSARSFSLQKYFSNKENMEDMADFEPERPVIYTLEEIEEATSHFDESKIVGEGGYGSVYFGALGQQEVAIKKMKSNLSKEFFAELKVLCKIHHINVVELLGYACGDDHLYLIYEYIQNGSLRDHLHDPLLKGHQPLSWAARAQIALDAAKGIEYIHDHTKVRYVHRDIKTSNILLDEGLRAKVADFGLAKLVGRANEEDPVATRLVGTPGYLPPESVKELQVTPKADVFAFGVVLAELITGQRALIRDNRVPNKMKSLITVVKDIFGDENPESALEAEIDGNLRSSYPIEDVFRMAEISQSCLSEEAVERPEMRDIVVALSHIVSSAREWEASLGGNSQVFSGLLNGR